MPQVFLATDFEQSRSLPLNSQRIVNFFTEKQPPASKSQTPLFGVPGLDVVATAGNGPVRGAWLLNETIYFVSGPDLYRLNSDNTVTVVGGGINGTNRVGMADNGTQLCIVNGARGWIYTEGGGLVGISSANFHPADVVIFNDGYFIFNWSGTKEWFLSALYDGLTYSGTDFASAESTSRPIVSIAQNLQLIYIFKKDVTELWYDAGNADFPYARYQGGIIPRGCASTFSVVLQDTALFFLGDDNIYYRMQGNRPIRVSTHAVETVLAEEAKAGTSGRINAFTWTWEGHKLIALVLPSVLRTLIYDISTGLWFERESADANGVSLGRWRIGTCIQIGPTQTYFCDDYDGRIWKENWNTFTEDGNILRGLIYSAPIFDDLEDIELDRFELDIESGVGNADAPDPQIMLRWSKDGGRTWSTVQEFRSMGKVGEYLKRLRWLVLGQARTWVFELTVADPVRRVIIAAHIDADQAVST